MNDDFGWDESIELPKPESKRVGRVMRPEEARLLESLIIPFLENLANSPGDTIHWPNRKERIEEQIAKIKAITEKY